MITPEHTAWSLLPLDKSAAPSRGRHRCVACGTETTRDRARYIYVRRAQELCFACEHWVALLTLEERSRCFVVEGEHYMAGSQGHETPAAWRGFGGRHFIVERLATGERIETVDLWYQGRIPEWFRTQLPDDAVFIRAPGDGVALAGDYGQE